VATNACLDELRRRRRRPLPGLPDDLGHPGHSDLGATAAGIEGLPDRLVIDDALDTLPEDFRAPVVLRDLCDLDYAEIARTLGIPPGTVRSRIARGRAQLAQLLDPGNQIAGSGRPTDRNDPRPRP
jgi:RNA polymerase sigma-70 factor, ECF subfamily